MSPAQALSKACRAGDPGAVTKALQSGANADEPWRKWAPLHAVIQEQPHGDGKSGGRSGNAKAVADRVRCLELLLKAGADPQQRSGWPPTTALLVAALGGHGAFVDALLARGVEVDDFAAAALGRLEPRVLKRRLAKHPEFAKARDASDLTLLHYVAGSQMGRDDERVARRLLATAEFLIEAGADPNARAKLWTHEIEVVYFAVGALSLPITQLLLEHGADANAALVTAMWNTGDHFAGFGELALAHGARPDAAKHEGKPLLNQLVRWGQFKPASWLLAHGASPNLADERGWTATHQAASRGNRNFWTAIVAAGGHRGRPAEDGTTPADLARRKRLPV